MEVDLCQRNLDKQLLWQVTIKQEDIIKMMIDICDERIDRLTVALGINKHSKRRKKMQQLLDIFIDFKAGQVKLLESIEV